MFQHLIKILTTTFSLCLALVIMASPRVWGDGAQANEEQDSWDVNAPNVSVEAKDIDINVSEGTWMSLDVSPDGKSIVFDMLGDIYQMPISGGTAERLLAGHAWEIQPQYSPDGRFIAFTSDRNGADNIWVMELADPENLQQITHESFRLMNNPSWHPSGDYLVAKKHFTTSRSLGTGELWLYPVNTGAALNNAMLSGSVLVKRPSASFQKELGERILQRWLIGVLYPEHHPRKHLHLPRGQQWRGHGDQAL